MCVDVDRRRARWQRSARALIGSTLVLIFADWPAASADNAKVARLTGPNDSTRAMVRSVAKNLPANHYTHRLLDEDVAESWCERFLDRLDPSKLYFLQSDVDAFRGRSKDLARQAQQGDAKFAYDVCRVYLDRLAQATKAAEELVAAEHDFTLDETLPIDSEVTTYPADEKEARERMRKRVKYGLLALRVSGVEDEAARKRLLSRYRSLLQRTQLTTDDDLMDAYLSSLTACYDPHSIYFSPKAMEDFEANVREQLEGIGAALQLVDGDLMVTSIVEDGPADKDGRLKKGMRIVAVGQGTDGKLQPVAGLSLREAVRLIRGKAGTIVRLQVLPENESDSRTLSIERARVQVGEARSTIVEHGRKPDGTPYKFGVINLPSLYSNTYDLPNKQGKQTKNATGDVRKILQDFRGSGGENQVDAVILDLRNNGGGALNEAITLPGLFLGKVPIVQTKDRNGKVQHYDSSEEKAVWTEPLIVLTSRNTGSGAELIAAALQDYGRALVIGDSTTSGNGTIQSLLDLGKLEKSNGTPPQLGSMKVTSQQFYRVNGESTQQRGVKADVVLPSLLDHRKTGEKYLDHALPFDQVDRLSHANFGSLTAAQRKKLQEASDQRQKDSKEFAAVEENIKALEARQARKNYSLNEEKAREEQRTIAPAEQDRPRTSGIFEETFYNDEVLAVAADYLQMLETSDI